MKTFAKKGAIPTPTSSLLPRSDHYSNFCGNRFLTFALLRSSLPPSLPSFLSSLLPSLFFNLF